MLASQQKRALTSIDWELQRNTYLQSAKSLNDEFERFKTRGGTFQPPAEVTMSLSAPRTGSDHQSVIRLPEGYRHLRICAGYAWVTYKAEDYVLSSGQEMHFDGDSSDVIVTSMGRNPVRFQISR